MGARRPTMKIYITIGLLILLSPSYLLAPLAPRILNAQTEEPPLHQYSVKELIEIYAAKYNVSSTTMDKVVGCETAGTYDPAVQSFIVTDGIREESFGLAQIHLPDWPEIKIEQAKDPDFALNFLASRLSQGQGNLWTCYRMLKESHII